MANLPIQEVVAGGSAALLVAGILHPTETGWLDGSTSVYCLSWIVLVVLWFFGQLVRPSSRLCWHWIDLVVVALISWIVVALLIRLAAGDANGRTALNSGWQWIAFGSCYLLIRQLFITATKQRDLVILMIGTTTFLGACGLYQFFYELPRSRAEYEQASESEKQEILRAAQVPAVKPGSRMRVLFENRLSSLEPMATLSLANSLGCLLSTWLVMAVGLTFAHARPLFSHRVAAAIWICALLMVAFALMLTKSRTGYLSAGFGLLLIGWIGTANRLSRRQWFMLTASGGGVLLILTLVGIGLRTLDVQIVTEAIKSFQYRIEYWQSSLAMIADSPLFGCGPGGFQDTYTLYKLPQASETVADPHNFVLEIAATCGVPAAILFSVCVLAPIVQSARQTIVPESTEADETPAATRAETSRENEGQHEATSSSATSDLLTAHLWIGALIGIPLGIVIGRSTGYQMAWSMLAVGLVTAVPTIFVASRWLVTASVPPWLFAVTLVTLLMNLLAAGGVTFLGIAQSLGLLLALTVSTLPAREIGARHRKTFLLVGLAISLLAAITNQRTMLLPVLNSKALTGEAEYLMQTRQFDEAEETLAEATQADAWNGDAWRLKAFLGLQRFRDSGNEDHLVSMQDALDEQIKKRPRTSQMYREIGDWYLMAFGRSLKLEYAKNAANYYLLAIERFPNNGWLHAQASYAFSLAGEAEAASREADEALRLDALTPHADLKLENRPIFLEDGTFSDESTEQLMEKLRIR